MQDGDQQAEQAPAGHPPAATPQRVFGRELRRLREWLGYTQADVSALLDVREGMKLDPSAIARMERDERTIRLNEAVALARLLDKTVDEMLRPGLPPTEQLRQAEQQAERTRWLLLEAQGQADAAQARLERLRKRLEEDDRG